MGLGPITVNNKEEVLRALRDVKTEKMFPDTPLIRCPRCGLYVPDFDGFGVLEHLELGARAICGQMDIPFEKYPKPCGYCSHPTLDGGVCSFCGATRGTEEYQQRRIP